jgi:hypothetical protein
MHPNRSTVRLTLAAVCALTATSRAQTLVRAVNGPAANAQFGATCVVVRDQNGDGYGDLLIGAPGFDQQRGAVLCISGAYLAFGLGTEVLWSIAPPVAPGNLFGYAIAEIPDATSDGVRDFLIGEPGHDSAQANDLGALRLVDGASHAIVSRREGIVPGGALGAAVADLRALGAVVFAAPGPLSNNSTVYVESAVSMAISGPIPGNMSYAMAGGNQFGVSLAAGHDLDADGLPEIVVGSPGLNTVTGSEAGAVVVLHLHLSSLGALGWGAADFYVSSAPGERMGSSVDAAHDYDGDGIVDIVAGAPNFPDALGGKVGRAVLLSGARLAAHTPPYELRTFVFSAAAGLDHHFGAAVRACDDLNGDGVGDVLIGAPGFRTTVGGLPLPLRGQVSIYSGASGARWAGINGGFGDHLGDALAGALGDLDGDGFAEFVLAGALSDVAGTDSGVIKCYRLFPVQPATYCTGKPNSQGCTPAISFSGTPNANSSTPFTIAGANFLNQKNGLLFYSHKPLSAAFQGGFKCAANPTLRTPPLNSGGSSTGSDCSGGYSFDFNAWIQNGSDPAAVAGAEVFAQYWARDPLAPSHTSLSNALRFLIQP